MRLFGRAFAALLVLSAGLATAAAAAVSPDIQSNDSVVVVAGASGAVSVYHLASGSWITLRLSGTVDAFDLCPSCPFLAISFQPEEATKTPRREVIINLETGREYTGARMALELGESRWSRNGRFAFFRSGSDVTLVDTKYLAAWLNGEPGSAGKEFKVEGHPLGTSWQVDWMGSNDLLFGTGLGEMACWGLARPEDRDVLLVGCCGVGRSEWDMGTCGRAISMAVPPLVAHLERKGRIPLPTLGPRFYSSVIDLLGRGDRNTRAPRAGEPSE